MLMHYLEQLKRKLDGGPDSGYGGEFCFDLMWPDTFSASGEDRPLSGEDKQKLLSRGYIKNDADFVKHILTKHDGEARIVFDRGYEALPDGIDIHRHNATSA